MIKNIESTEETLILARIADGDNPIVSWSEDGKPSWDYSLIPAVDALVAKGLIAKPNGESPWNLFTRWRVVRAA
jgi:hypothetical protein